MGMPSPPHCHKVSQDTWNYRRPHTNHGEKNKPQVSATGANSQTELAKEKVALRHPPGYGRPWNGCPLGRVKLRKQ